MRERGRGSIIVAASDSGVFYDHEMIARATSKHAAVTIVQQSAIDYGKYGGREALLAYVKDTIPMGRFATVDNFAESILSLASDRSSFMTGHAFVVDGGECIV